MMKSQIIKSRRAKNSQRGLYIQDLQLKETVFQPGTHFTYIVDRKEKKLIILQAKDGNTVSKRSIRDGMKPVLDIRNKEALAVFHECDYLQIEIFEQEIIVRGFEESKDTEQKHSQKNSRYYRKVCGIKQLLQVKQTAIAVMSRSELEKAVGGYEQLSFSFFEEEIQEHQSSSVRYIKDAIKHAGIALAVDSFFSGAGLMDYGFLQEDFDFSLAVELDKDAADSYRANIGNHVHSEDIRKVDPKRYTSPVMIAGTPCQGISNTNRINKAVDNPNNLLTSSYVNAIKMNPNCKVFAIENVPQILTEGGGVYIDEIRNSLSDFEITYGVLNAADFGAPQVRERCILIGSKIGRIDLPKPSVPKRLYQTVRDAFRNLLPSTKNQQDISKPKPITLERIRSVPAGGNVADIPTEIRPKGTHSNMYKRLEWDKPSITIVNPRKSMILHPEEDRILSVRECARIQGLPDSFSFCGSLNARQQQVANGVPYQLARAIAKVIREAIERFNIQHREAFV
ncbi:DNA cytosine methyltransferase [Paenibacillus alvei]|uniref:DNA (cytosine-5-)-methyltransferase n=1 Tax=Paenibacillus alvei TaxID=44250 RepID=A0ABT4H3D8_PAEAL|nr:DNA cytosine methyltransferase [Paenibacillus alvei]MCY9763176.1 DNA cytosine methyltransferase [Paenibacillus alvei]MCY9769534.1 DNA cytosine methyltransferase [Paenibacillus alvei]